jgi:class 3 adenylate cyclase
MVEKTELEAYINRTFSLESWQVEEARVVPFTKDVPLSNAAKHFDHATFLYADLSGSTKMVEQLNWSRSAEIYKNYLYCASRLIRHFQGDVVAFDGDRVMGVFLNEAQCTNAVRCALRINWALRFLVQPGFEKQYGATFTIGHTIGIDASEARCCRTGVRGDNDLVWIGAAPNIAAKLTDLTEFPIWITNTVYDRMANEVKTYTDGRHMWEQRSC